MRAGPAVRGSAAEDGRAAAARRAPLDRYGHLFPEADTALRARLDGLFRAATEHRRSTVA
jgi:hypothetical protein